MTTIACNRTEMASDSSLVQAGIIQHSCKKLFVTPEGIVGFAGYPSHGQDLVRALMGDMEWDQVDMADTDALLLNKQGIHFYCEHVRAVMVTDEFAAIGSGAQAAMAAMTLGASPREAVEIASAVDPNTCGTVQVYTLRDVRRPRRRKKIQS